MKIIPSKYAEPLFTQEFYEADIWGGRGRGGSHNITMHTLLKMMTPVYFRGYFVRAIHGHIRDSLWQDFKDRIEEASDVNHFDYFQYFHIVDNKMEAICKLNGNTIKSKGFKASSKGQTAHMKSIAGATHVYIEECEEVGEEEYNKLADSLRTIKAPVQIIRSWNAPSKEHWLVRDYFDLMPSGIDGYYKLKPKGIDGHLSVYGTYKNNIKNLDKNTLARYERYEQNNKKYFYNQIKGLVSDGGDKKVYYNWQIIPYKEFLKIDGYECFGLDFGDVSPTALIHIKYRDGKFYRHQVLYESLRSMAVRYREQMGNDKETDNSIWGKHKGLLSYVFNLKGVDRNTPIFCDPAQKGLIIELRENGFNAVEAKKDKQSNINFINRAENYITDESLDLQHEYDHYYLDTDVNKNPIDGKPIKGNDHGIDAQEYGCRGIKDMLGITL